MKKEIEPFSKQLSQKRYIGAEKLNMHQLRTISSEKQAYILIKNNIGAN